MIFLVIDEIEKILCPWFFPNQTIIEKILIKHNQVSNTFFCVNSKKSADDEHGLKLLTKNFWIVLFLKCWNRNKLSIKQKSEILCSMLQQKTQKGNPDVDWTDSTSQIGHMLHLCQTSTQPSEYNLQQICCRICSSNYPK